MCAVIWFVHSLVLGPPEWGDWKPRCNFCFLVICAGICLAIATAIEPCFASHTLRYSHDMYKNTCLNRLENTIKFIRIVFRLVFRGSFTAFRRNGNPSPERARYRRTRQYFSLAPSPDI